MAYDIVEKVKSKFAPDGAWAAVEKNRALKEFKMDPNEDPTSAIERLMSIGTMYQTPANPVLESELITTLLDASPHTDIILRAKKEKGNALKLDDLEDDMRDKWRVEMGKKGIKVDDFRR